MVGRGVRGTVNTGWKRAPHDDGLIICGAQLVPYRSNPAFTSGRGARSRTSVRPCRRRYPISHQQAVKDPYNFDFEAFHGSLKRKLSTRSFKAFIHCSAPGSPSQ